MRIQVVGRNGRDIFKGGVEVPEEVSFGQFPYLVHFISYLLSTCCAFSLLRVLNKGSTVVIFCESFFGQLFIKD